MPLRVRLTLWYGTALVLVLIIFGGALYAVLARGLRDQIDRSLDEAAVVAVRAVEQHGLGPFLPFEDLAAEFPELAVLDKSFQIFSPAGKITIQSPNLRRQDIPLSPTALAAALNGQATFESARFQDGSTFRLLSVPIRENGVLVNIVQVGTSLRPVEEMLHRLVLVLLVLAPIALAVALGGGWFLADRALRPVEAITQAAQRIAAGDLTQRLAAPSTSDEIGRLAATFNDMIARLETSFRQMRQFSADASHELRTPLTVIKGEAELALRRTRPAEDYKLVLESTLEEIDRMTQIVDELLFLSRTDLGEVVIERLPVRLDALVEDIRRQTGVLGQEQGVQVTVGSVDPATVLGDELRLRELLLNLVDNAVKYSRPGGKVEIALLREGAAARLSVTDQGIGMTPEEMGRIFDRFYRTDAARAHAKKGTGLGLSICKWIAEAHHGRIEVQSHVGEGSRFTVVLPVTPS
ncbi:MAG: heavy metal sensor histidine kinase [Nitrospirae bacterium]|nr:MAG: heavy metal sensor histidine kinase [Nitrospirota bacterium]